MTIQEAQAAKRELEATILKAIVDFETQYGQDAFLGLTFRRYNGSNDAWGRVVSVSADIRLVDGKSSE